MAFFSDYLGKPANELFEDLKKLISQFNDYTNSKLLIYSADLRKSNPDISLNMEDYYMIVDLINDLDSNSLTIYLETPGGSGETAEEIVRYLRNEFKNIDFVISGEAKSAGTILALSGDSISMTKTGALGPIDAQVKIGRMVISAHDYMEWVDNKHKKAGKNGKLNPFDATMIAQISPGELKQVHNSLKYAHDLVEEWLCNYKFKDWNKTETRGIEVTDEMKTKRAKEIAEELTNHSKWRSHGRSLKIEDLHDIGLKIKKVDNDPTLADIVYRIQTVLRFIYSSTAIYKVLGTSTDVIRKTAIPQQSTSQSSKDVPQQSNKEPDAVKLDITCPKCDRNHSLYAKFKDDPKIDKDFKAKGIKKFPQNNQLNCDCGFEIDLLGLRNQVETGIGKSIV